MIPFLALMLAFTPANPVDAGTRGAAAPLPAASKTAPQPHRIALHADDSGVVRVRLTFAANGTATDCTVVKSVTPELDRATCEGLMDRERFDPVPEGADRPRVTSVERTVLWWR
jgi:TonB family protein